MARERQSIHSLVGKTITEVVDIGDNEFVIKSNGEIIMQISADVTLFAGDGNYFKELNKYGEC